MRRSLILILLLAAPAARAAIAVETVDLGHGVHAWYATNDRVPVVDIQLSFDGGGAASDPEGRGGRAAFVASLLNEGAGTLDSVAFHRALEDAAITLEASTDEDRLLVHVHCLRDAAPRAGELLALALSKPQLADADQARMKNEIAALQRQLKESGGYQAPRLLAARAFAGHPYANPPYGTPESLAALSTADARDYLASYVTRSNLQIAAAGDVDSSLLDQMLGPVIETLPDRAAPLTPVAPVAMQGGGESLSAHMPLPQSTVVFAGPGVARDDTHFYAAYLLNRILGGDPLDARLAQLRRNGGLVYTIGSELDVRRGVSLFSGALGTRNSTAAEAQTQVKAVLAQLHDRGVTTQECADARSYVLGAFPLQLDSSRSVAGMLLTMQYLNLGADYLEKRTGYFNAVTCADINALAAEMLAPERFLFATVGGTADGPAPAAAMPAGDAR